MDGVPSLLQICTQKLARNIISHGRRKVHLASLSTLPRRVLEALLEILVAKNALAESVLLHVLTSHIQNLCLGGCAHLRRCALYTIGRSCLCLRVLDVSGLQQINNKIVCDVLQNCEYLVSVKLDGCPRITDSAFMPALWSPPLVGLLGLRELSVAKCGQITSEGLMGYVMKSAPKLKSLGLAFCRIAITDEVTSALLFSFGLETLDFSHCAQITDGPFQSCKFSQLLEICVAHTHISDVAAEGIAHFAPQLVVFDASWVMKLTDRGVLAITESCRQLQTLRVSNTQVTNVTFEAVARCNMLQVLDASWCLCATSGVFDVLAAAQNPPPLKELVLDQLGALSPQSQMLGNSCQSVFATASSIKSFVVTYGYTIEQLFLDGMKGIVNADGLEAIAAMCPALRQLALSLPPESKSAGPIEAGLRAIGTKCKRMSHLRLDTSNRPHHEVVSTLVLPAFANLRSLNLWCPAKGGIIDSELEAILDGRIMLETLSLQNCEGLSHGLFPRWSNREEQQHEMVRQLDQALLSSMSFGHVSEQPRQSRKSIRSLPNCPAALTLRGVVCFSLSGATALLDRSCDALAELLHDVQVIDLRGCPLITEESLRSLKKGCRFLRSVCIVTRDRTLTWTSTCTVRRHHHVRTSGSSGTESN